MITIQRANTILDIEDEDIDRYMAMGYNIIDDFGNIIKEAIPTEVGALQRAYVENRRKIEQLEKELNELKLKTQEIKKVSRKAQN